LELVDEGSLVYTWGRYISLFMGREGRCLNGGPEIFPRLKGGSENAFEKSRREFECYCLGLSRGLGKNNVYCRGTPKNRCLC